MLLCACYKKHSFLKGDMEMNVEILRIMGLHFKIILTPTEALAEAPVPPKVPIPLFAYKNGGFFPLKHKKCKTIPVRHQWQRNFYQGLM